MSYGPLFGVPCASQTATRCPLLSAVAPSCSFKQILDIGAMRRRFGTLLAAQQKYPSRSCQAGLPRCGTCPPAAQDLYLRVLGTKETLAKNGGRARSVHGPFLFAQGADHQKGRRVVSRSHGGVPGRERLVVSLFSRSARVSAWQRSEA